MLTSGSQDGVMKLWDVASGRELRTLNAHSRAVSSVAFSPNGKLLASGSFDQTIALWDVVSENELRRLKRHSGSVFSVVLSPDGKTVASGVYLALVRVGDHKEVIKVAVRNER